MLKESLSGYHGRITEAQPSLKVNLILLFNGKTNSPVGIYWKQVRI